MDEIGFTIVDKRGRCIARRPTTKPSWLGGGTSPGAIKVYDNSKAARQAARQYGGKIVAVLVSRIEDAEAAGLEWDEVW